MEHPSGSHSGLSGLRVAQPGHRWARVASLAELRLLAVVVVAVVGARSRVVGVLTLATKRKMMEQVFALPRGLVLRGMILAAASQSLWWTAVVIGFINSQG